MSREFQRSFEALDDVFAFADHFFEANAIEDRSAFALKLAIEEVFTNFVKYNPDSPELLRINLERIDTRVVATLVDPDTIPFDITEYDLADTSSALEERTPGGLGIYLVRRMVDDLTYEHRDRTSTITLTKHLSS